MIGFIHGYRGYTIIPNPLETFIIKISLPVGIFNERNCVKKEGVHKLEKMF